MWTTLLKRHNYLLFELFIFFRGLSFAISSIATSLLLQDKICLLNYHQNASFCDTIQKLEANSEATEMKDHILAESAQFSNYM